MQISCKEIHLIFSGGKRPAQTRDETDMPTSDRGISITTSPGSSQSIETRGRKDTRVGMSAKVAFMAFFTARKV